MSVNHMEPHHSDIDFKDSVVMITGGTGSWGNELTRQLLEKYSPKEIRIFSRGEFAQVTMARKFNYDPRLKFVIGDVRDEYRVREAMRNVDYVFHLAALKHVPICEEHPWESITTNINGVENVVRGAIANDVKVVVDSSTDKACSPLNTYGACKSVGEKLITSANNRFGETRFVCIRAGNVMGTNGSVIPFFREKILRGQPVPITDTGMTRYFMTLPEAIGLLFKATFHSIGGEIYVTKMPACKILDLAKALAHHYNKNLETEVIGIRQGEKLHEMLVSEYEAMRTVEDEDFKIILPMDNSLNEAYGDYKKAAAQPYTSNDLLMEQAQILDKLAEGGFLDGEPQTHTQVSSKTVSNKKSA